MKKHSRSSSAITQFLSGYNPRIQLLTSDLRVLVKETIPEAEETLYVGWKGIGYRHPKARYFCGIFPGTDLVRLGFEHGALIPDSDGLLKSGVSKGKQVLYVEIRSKKDIQVRKISQLLRLAISL